MISLEIKLPATYLTVKREELEFLAENSKTPFSFARAKKWTFSDLFQFYCELRESGQRQSRGYLGESGMPGVEIPVIGGFKFDYSYQRLRLNSTNHNPFGIIHPSSDIKFAVQSLFLLSSAQAGLTQLLESIHQSWGRLPVWTPYSCFHETKRHLKIFGWKFNQNEPAQPSILIFDSSTFQARDQIESLNLKAKVRLIIFDTTCFSRQSPFFFKALKVLKKFNCPIVLVRSALKLDNLGMEWGRFGHLLYLDSKRSPELESLIATYNQLTSHFGTSASTRQVYPFYDNSTMQTLGENWAERIRKSNQLAVASLRQNSGLSDKDIVEYQHQNFFWLSLPTDLANSHREEERICKSLYFHKVPYIVASSFPWSSLALTSFCNRKKFKLHAEPLKTDPRYLRISFGDFDESTASEYAETLSRTLNMRRR